MQWQVSTDGGATFSNVAGATSTTLMINNVPFTSNGYEYQAVFTNAAGSATSASATLTVQVPPSVTLNPTPTTVTAGTAASFTASSSGSPTPTVQWQGTRTHSQIMFSDFIVLLIIVCIKVSTDGGATFSNVAGATSTTLMINNVPFTSNGYEYQAVFTNAAGSATSASATLTVQVPPSVTLNPTPTTVTAGTAASFTASSSGSPTPAVQWQVSTDGGATFSNVAGATSTTLMINNVPFTSNGYEYHAVFTNAAGSATSASATLTVSLAPIITMQPMSVSVTVGSTATFTAAATGYTSVQWSFTGSSTRRRSVLGGVIPGATSTSFTTNPTTLAFNGNTYSATFTSAFGVSTTTLAATLTVASSASASGDPHLVGFDGQQYDFVGEVGSVYNFLTDSEVQFNALLGSVRATEHLNLPGEFITAIGIKFRNHSVVVDGGSHLRVGSVMIDHRPAKIADTINNIKQQQHHAILLVDGELRVEHEVFVDAMSGEDFGLRDAKQRIVGRVIVTTPSFSFSIFMVEEGFDEVDKRWIKPFPRRFLGLSVRLERADIGTPHGVLGQSLHAMRDRKERGVPIGEAGAFSIEGRTEDYRVGRGAESLLGDSFAFNRFGTNKK